MFGDQALALINDARRSTATDTLFKYNDQAVRNVARELRALDTDIANALKNDFEHEPPQPVMCATTIYHIATRHNKRCLLAYLNHRLDRLRDMYWAAGCSLPHLLNDPDTRQKLSPHEVDFLRQYNTLVMDYRSDFIDVLDLAMGLTRPPKDLHIEVRVVAECGAIETESGSIDFQKGQRYLVKRADVEHLIVQGYLEPI
jgi:GINS complex subunit 1